MIFQRSRLLVDLRFCLGWGFPTSASRDSSGQEELSMSDHYWLSEAQLERLNPYFPRSHALHADSAGLWHAGARAFGRALTHRVFGTRALAPVWTLGAAHHTLTSVNDL